MIADRIREFGESNFNSLGDFAKALGLSPQGLNKYISGHNVPGAELLVKLIGLGADVYYILVGDYNKDATNTDKLIKEIIILKNQIKQLNVKNIKLEGQIELLTSLLKKGDWFKYEKDEPRLRAVSEDMPVYKG